MGDLSEHLRHLFVVQTLGEVPATFAVTAEHTDRLNAQADRLPRPRCCARSTCSRDARSAVKDGSEPRIQLELALLKAVQPQADLSIQALLFRIEQLERAACSGLGVPGAASGRPRRRRRGHGGERIGRSGGPARQSAAGVFHHVGVLRGSRGAGPAQASGGVLFTTHRASSRSPAVVDSRAHGWPRRRAPPAQWLC